MSPRLIWHSPTLRELYSTMLLHSCSEVFVEGCADSIVAKELIAVTYETYPSATGYRVFGQQTLRFGVTDPTPQRDYPNFARHAILIMFMHLLL